LALWRDAERWGFDACYVFDHFVPLHSDVEGFLPEEADHADGPCLEATTTLAALARAVPRIGVGLMVAAVGYRAPGLLAHAATTLAHAAGGRLELGIGAGWFKPEHDNLGIEFPPPGELVARFREAVELIDTMLRHDTSSYSGRYYQLNDAPCRPAPLQKPRPPLTLGAHGPKMLRIVAEHADRWNSHGTVAEIRERNATLNELCAKIGRDPATITRSLYAWATQLSADPWSSLDAFQDMVGRYHDVGIHEFIVDAPGKGQYPVMERVAAEILPMYR
jgi:alkanesulfonate monooxygenase SsuD/methylene tetrahydromethanopterin reductase-like flavin-dependent oxidoreductase (luciferase family)